MREIWRSSCGDYKIVFAQRANKDCKKSAQREFEISESGGERVVHGPSWSPSQIFEKISSLESSISSPSISHLPET